MTDGAGNATRYAYDTRGNLIAINRSRSAQSHGCEHDSRGQVTKLLDPLGGAHAASSTTPIGNLTRAHRRRRRRDRFRLRCRGPSDPAPPTREGYTATIACDAMGRPVTSATDALGQVRSIRVRCQP